jgi:hypothetical protein
MRWVLHVISKFGYDIYMAEFGGERDEMYRKRLLGWACYIAAVEPDLGYPLLRAFDELVPEWYNGIREWADTRPALALTTDPRLAAGLRPVGAAVGPKRPHADALAQAAAVSGASRP